MTSYVRQLWLTKYSQQRSPIGCLPGAATDVDLRRSSVRFPSLQRCSVRAEHPGTKVTPRLQENHLFLIGQTARGDNQIFLAYHTLLKTSLAEVVAQVFVLGPTLAPLLVQQRQALNYGLIIST